MKKYLFLLICALSITQLCAKEKNKGIGATVDERVELLSVVFRLAGNREYSSNEAENYVNDIQKWFEPYKEDTLIRYVRRLRNATGVGYDAVAQMSVVLKGKGGQYYLPEDAKNIEALYERTDDRGRWNRWNAPIFVELLNQFYAKTRFDKFFKEHKTWYKQMTDRFDSQIAFNRDWYAKFYGETSDSDYRVILGCSNGGSNYGPNAFSDDGKNTAYAILGCWAFGQDGLSDFVKGEHISILIHEFNHSFANIASDWKLDQNDKARLEAAGNKIFTAVKDEMSVQAYGAWTAVLNEALVRAAVVRYMRDNDFSQQEIDAEIRDQHRRCFLWTAELDSLLGVYASQRDKYPSLKSFSPRIIDFFESVAQRIDQMKADYLSHCPKVIAISPDINGRDDVDPSITEIKVIFDRSILVNAQNSAGLGGIKGLEHPARGKREAGDVDKEENFKIWTVELKPDTKYGFIVMGFAPATKDGYPLGEKYRVEFRTRK